MLKKKNFIMPCIILAVLSLALMIGTGMAKYISTMTGDPLTITINGREYIMTESNYGNTYSYTLDDNGALSINSEYYDTEEEKWYMVTEIADNGFSSYPGCEEIKSIFIPKTVKTIGDHALSCPNLESITVDEANTAYHAEGGILFNKDKTTLVRYASDTANTFYSVPSTVERIAEGAFQYAENCTAIISVLYHENAWGLPSGVILNTVNLGDRITNVTGNITDGFTVSLENSEHGKGVVIQGNDPDNHVYGIPKNVRVDGQNITIPAEYCQPCDAHDHFAQIYLSAWQHMAYAHLTAEGTLEIHNCDAAIVNGEVYQWVNDDDDAHKVLPNNTLYNLPSNAGSFNPLPEGFASWDDLNKNSVKKVRIADSIAPDTLTYGVDSSNGRSLTWFNNMTNCTEMDLANLDTSKVTDMSYMFINCKNLSALDLSTFDTSRVTSMFCMFYYCYRLGEINLTGVDTSNVKNMAVMFAECKALVNLDVSQFVTTKTTQMYSMFYMCTALKNLDLSNFNTENVTRMDRMFMETAALATLVLSSFNTEKVTNMTQMFTNSYTLKNLDISTFNTSNVTGMEEMFKGSNSLKTITVSSNFVVNRDTTTNDMFTGCGSLVGGKGTSYNSNQTGRAYACIDGMNGQRGYFTAAPGVTVTPANVRITVDPAVADGYTASVIFLGEAVTVTLTGVQDASLSQVTLTCGDVSESATVTNGIFTIPASFVTNGAEISVS